MATDRSDGSDNEVPVLKEASKGTEKSPTPGLDQDTCGSSNIKS